MLTIPSSPATFIVATAGTYAQLAEAGIPATRVNKSHEGRPNLIDEILNGNINLVVNTPSATGESAEDDSYIRKTAIKAHVPYMTTMAAGFATAQGIKTIKEGGDGEVKSLQEWHAAIK